MKLITVILTVLLLSSCSFEFSDDQTRCDDRKRFINAVADEKINRIYFLCPDKCELANEIKKVNKQRQEMLDVACDKDSKLIF
jgi:hypothetical protein